MLAARISLTLSRHSSLSFIALGRSLGQQPVSSHSCWMYVRAGRPAFARPYVGIHKSTSLMSSSLLLQQCPACLVRLTWIVFVIGGKKLQISINSRFIYIYKFEEHFFIDSYLIKHYRHYLFANCLLILSSCRWAESTWEITNYRWFINQFPPDIIRSIR